MDIDFWVYLIFVVISNLGLFYLVLSVRAGLIAHTMMHLFVHLVVCITLREELVKVFYFFLIGRTVEPKMWTSMVGTSGFNAFYQASLLFAFMMSFC